MTPTFPTSKDDPVEPYDDAVTADEFATSKNLFDLLVADLAAPATGELTHAELEEQCLQRGRAVVRQLLQDHLDLRARREETWMVADHPAGRLEKGHRRLLATVFGTVTVTRCALRAPGRRNRYPADDRLALPAGRYSHRLQKLAVAEAVRGSFDDAHAAITDRYGKVIGKRQIADQVVAAAVDIDPFTPPAFPSPAPSPRCDQHRRAQRRPVSAGRATRDRKMDLRTDHRARQYGDRHRVRPGPSP